MATVGVNKSSSSQNSMEQVSVPLPFTKEAIVSLNNGSMSFEHARALFNVDLSTFKAKLLEENIFVWNDVKWPVRIHGGDYVLYIVIKRLRKVYMVQSTDTFEEVVRVIEMDLSLTPGHYILTYKHPVGNIWVKSDYDWHYAVEFSKAMGYHMLLELETFPLGQIADLYPSDEDACDD
ncbi:hypothetical protein Tco_0051165 [Tanacetum coccineum]